jgi:putative membrane protein
LIVSAMFEGIHVEGVGWAFVAAVFLGLFNAILRPVLFMLTLPLTVMTLGLFTMVINALMLKLTGWLLAGFSVQGFWTAVGGAVIMSLISLAANTLLGSKKPYDQNAGNVIQMRRHKNGTWE